MKSGNKLDPEKFLKESSGSQLIFKEAIVLEAHPQILDLSSGQMVADVILGRRVLNAVMVPFSLADISESINDFRWHACRIENHQVYLPYDGAQEFSTTYSDARWITRRIAQLSRPDWSEILSVAGFPDGVRDLVLEKLISRRNSLMECLGMGSATHFYVNSDVNYGDVVRNGKVIKADWPLYGTDFSGDDPESPVDGKEIFALFQSKVFSNVLFNFVDWVNRNKMPRTQLDKEIVDHQIDLAAKQFAEFIGTGEVTETPLGFWSTPYHNVNLIASRDVVAGSYLGSENTVQLADTVGINMATGLYVGVDGLPGKLGVNGRGQVFFTKTFTKTRAGKAS